MKAPELPTIVLPNGIAFQPDVLYIQYDQRVIKWLPPGGPPQFCLFGDLDLQAPDRILVCNPQPVTEYSYSSEHGYSFD